MTPSPTSRRSPWPIVAGIGGVAVVIAAVLVMTGTIGGGAAAQTPDPSASVPGVIPADANVVAEGRAVPATSAEIVTPAGGQVTVVKVAPGDAVTAGQVVLELDHAAADLQVESATQAKAAADAAVERAKAGVSQAEAAVKQADAGVTQAQAGVDQAQASYNAANGSVSQASAAVRAAQAARDALPKGSTSAVKRQANAQIDQARAGVTAAVGQRAAAKAGVAAAKGAVTSAKAGVASAKAALITARTALTAAEADAERAAIAIRQAEQARDQLLVTSPVAGTVVGDVPAVGDLAQPGAVLVRIEDASGWQFETTDLSETSIARVQEGASVSVTVDGLPGVEIPATVQSVGGYGQPSQGDIVYKVVAVPTGEVPSGLRWNMTVTMDITGAAAD
jgi:multidrug efflux pump subunit AcrA (membrane-fusion protein)